MSDNWDDIAERFIQLADIIRTGKYDKVSLKIDSPEIKHPNDMNISMDDLNCIGVQMTFYSELIEDVDDD